MQRETNKTKTNNQHHQSDPTNRTIKGMQAKANKQKEPSSSKVIKNNTIKDMQT